jgi:hypothetical protein
MGWIALGEPLSLPRGRDVIRLGAASPFDQIRIQSTAGATYISHVVIRYRDGARQVVKVNRWISREQPMLQLEVNGTRPIDRLVVGGSPSRWSRYQVFGHGLLVRDPQPPLRGVTLATALNFAGTTGYKLVSVGAEKGRFGTLQLQGESGRIFVKRVEVQFTNGHSQTFAAVDRILYPGQVLNLPLDGNGAYAIRQLVIFTNDTLARVDHPTGELDVSAF